MSDELDVLGINEAFYDAFSRRDAGALERLWAKGEGLSCIHPGWDALRGREEVLSSFRAILEHDGAPRIRCYDATVELLGDVALVVCRESVGGEHETSSDIIATNVFVRAGDRWKMIHHHGGPLSLRRGPSRPPAPPRKRSDLN